jgi:hypothetical protein
MITTKQVLCAAALASLALTSTPALAGIKSCRILEEPPALPIGTTGKCSIDEVCMTNGITYHWAAWSGNTQSTYLACEQSYQKCMDDPVNKIGCDGGLYLKVLPPL